MEKLAEVETAKALMTEAVTWSVIKWLREKKRVRRTADRANAALDQLNQAVKERWPDAIRAAYHALGSNAAGAATSTSRNRQEPAPSGIDSDTRLMAKKIKEADNEANRARMDAEQTFDEAEKQLSTALAREGCRKAILSWDLREKAIRKAEAVIAAR